MDLSGQQQKSQAGSKYNYHRQFLKKASQFIVSFSTFSFLLSFSSALIFFCLCFNSHFSTLLFSLFSHTIETKYVFLVCNGILAFLVKLSSSNGSPPAHSYVNGDLEKGMKGGAEAAAQLHKLGDKKANAQSVGNAVTHVEEKETKEQQNGLLKEEMESGDNDGDEDVKEPGASGLIPASSVEDEGNEVDLSTDELNRKFDEFIRRMKEEIRNEPQ